MPSMAIPSTNFRISGTSIDPIIVIETFGGRTRNYILTLDKAITQSDLDNATITISTIGAPMVNPSGRTLIEYLITANPPKKTNGSFKLQIKS